MFYFTPSFSLDVVRTSYLSFFKSFNFVLKMVQIEGTYKCVKTPAFKEMYQLMGKHLFY